MVKFIEVGDSLYFELFGGSHVYNKITKTYSIDRPYGIFSNITVSIYAIFSLEISGYEVKNIKFILNEYIPGEDLYDELFEIRDFKINLENIESEKINLFKDKFYPTHYGLGFDIKNINFEISSQIYNKFFTPSKWVVEYINNILKSKNIEDLDFVFIWARKTDKTNETEIPSVEKYLEVLSTNNMIDKKIILQTDDNLVLNEFNEKIEIDTLEDIPQSNDGWAFHGRLDMVSDDIFHSKYNMTKKEYIKKMIGVNLIATKSKFSILYPGNPTTTVTIAKGNFNNLFLFRDKNNLF